MTTLVKRIAERTGFTPATISEMTVYQGCLWLEDGDYTEQLGRWRCMSPAVRLKMKLIEGFEVG